ncbi:hypothetical protein [Pelagibacterium lacus]|uniref:DUF998 domain-containing protein n=1 Tax=Pelagibacterium lacus TaxID=2282655 RepID=A0A369W528_9HYPH|nr:hypothetical protein [Pelagibacterium lacus]RDE09668.1 hypothetical protein DVH29_05795 [Pelagibacterium lacus]
MILALVLIAGTLLWAGGEIAMLAAGGIMPTPGWIATLGLYVAGAGCFALKDLPAVARPGRVGIVLVAFGAISFATVMTIVLTSGLLGAMAEGAVGHAQMVYTPFYLLALVFMVAGLVALALHFRAAPGPQGAFWGAALLAVLTLARLVFASLPLYHEAVSALVALYLLWLGVIALRRTTAQSTGRGAG